MTQRAKHIVAAVLLLVVAAVYATQGAAAATSLAQARDILLVHGAFADASSSWTNVITQIRRKQHNALTLHAVQLDEDSWGGDVEIVRRALRAIGRPTVLVGHSYGGAVISLASVGQPNVTALVFCAAYAPDANETIIDQNSHGPPPPGLAYFQVDEAGYLYLETSGFITYFAAGIKASTASILALTQKTVFAGAFQTPAPPTPVGWRTIPSYYQVSNNDSMISPDVQRFNAARMNAVEVLSLNAGHLAIVTKAPQVASLIIRATGI